MAVTKIHGIKATVNKAIEYICNPAKTDEKIYISSFAYSPETAALDFKFTLDHTTEQSSVNGHNRENKAFHLIQAFEPGEVSYNTAHTIGKELADKLLEGKYSYVLTTHIDKGHVHNHIIFCAADNINHNHYHDCQKSYWHIRNLSDQLCQEHGLSVIQPSGKRGEKYNEWNARQNGQSIKVQIRKDINQFIKLSSSYEEFLALMQAKRYSIKYSLVDENSGKYISFRPVGHERFIRGSIKSLGRNYTKERIKERIEEKRQKALSGPKSQNKLKQLVTTNGHISFNDNSRLQKWATKENLQIAAQTYNQMKVRNIHDFEELAERISSQQQLSKLTNSSIVSIEHRLQELAEIIKYAEQYQETKPFYDRYKKAADQDRMLRKYESQIILFSGAEHMLQSQGFDPQKINLNKLHLKYNEMAEKKKVLTRQLNADRSELKELELIQKNLLDYLKISTNNKETAIDNQIPHDR